MNAERGGDICRFDVSVRLTLDGEHFSSGLRRRRRLCQSKTDGRVDAVDTRASGHRPAPDTLDRRKLNETPMKRCAGRTNGRTDGGPSGENSRDVARAPRYIVPAHATLHKHPAGPGPDRLEMETIDSATRPAGPARPTTHYGP